MKVTEAQLLDYLEGRLSPGERAQVEDYLARNPEVRHELEQMRALASALRAVDMPTPPPGFAKRVSARLDEAIAQRHWFRTKVLIPRLALFGVMGYALLFVIGVAVLLLADVPLIQPFFTLLRILASVAGQMLGPFATLVRVLLSQPLGWLALVSAAGIVVAWSLLLRQVWSRPPALTKP